MKSMILALLLLFAGDPAAEKICPTTRIAAWNEIPGIKDQRAVGMSILAMARSDDKIYFGYGNGKSNTGPIDIVCYDPEAQKFATEFRAATEVIDRFSLFAGQLSIPNTEPLGIHQTVPGQREIRKVVGEGSVFVRDASNKSWKELVPIPKVVHVFDACEFQSSLYAGGSEKDGPSALYVLAEDKQSWKELRRFTPTEPGGFARIYSLGADDKKLFGTGWFHGKNGRYQKQFAFFYDGKSFEDLQVPDGGHLVPILFGGGIKIAVFENRVGYGSEANAICVIQENHIAGYAHLPKEHRLRNWFVDGDTFYGLFQSTPGSYSVWSSPDLSNWRSLGSLPVLANKDEYRTICLVKGKVYLGTKDGNFWSTL